MEWKQFKESEKEYPERIVSDLITGFSKATSHLCEIQISQSEQLFNNLNVDFVFHVILRSNTIKSYRFEIFRFGYNVDLFPVFVVLEEGIYMELNIERTKRYHDIINLDDEERFKSLLKAVFNSNRFQEVVSGLMKISKKYLEDEPLSVV